jgi:hypothetical protein
MALYALATLILLVALACILYGPWQTLCTDVARQMLFELRDELFDLGARGELPFQGNQYKTIRTSIEQNIRYAHTLSIWRFIAIFAHTLRSGNIQKSSRTLAIESLDNVDLRKKLSAMNDRIRTVNLLMMVAKSPLMIILLALAAVIGAICSAFGVALDHCRLFFNKAGETIQVEAEACA